MNNQEILQKIVAYIEAIMVDKSMTSRDLAEICAKRSGKMSPPLTVKVVVSKIYIFCSCRSSDIVLYLT